MCRGERVDGDNVVRPLLSGSESYDAAVLSKEDQWIEKLDHEAFQQDVKELGKALADQQGPEDVVRGTALAPPKAMAKV